MEFVLRRGRICSIDSARGRCTSLFRKVRGAILTRCPGCWSCGLSFPPSMWWTRERFRMNELLELKEKNELLTICLQDKEVCAKCSFVFSFPGSAESDDNSLLGNEGEIFGGMLTVLVDSQCLFSLRKCLKLSDWKPCSLKCVLEQHLTRTTAVREETKYENLSEYKGIWSRLRLSISDRDDV